MNAPKDIITYLKKTMKTIKLTIACLAMLAVFSCNKSTNTTPANSNVSNAEAADLAASSLSQNSNGVATAAADGTNVGSTSTVNLSSTNPGAQSLSLNTNNATSLAFVPRQLLCGATLNDTVTRKNSIGDSISYTYNSIYTFTLHCTNNSRDSLTESSVFNGTHSGPYCNTVYNGTNAFTVGGLSSTATNFVINGQHNRSGSFVSKKDTSNHGTHTINVIVKNLTLSKPARTIISGTATFTITGNTTKKGSWSYTGTIVYSNDGIATLTIAGIGYRLNIFTGRLFKI